MPTGDIWYYSELAAACALAVSWINDGVTREDCGAHYNGQRPTKTAAYKALCDRYPVNGRSWKAWERKIGNASAVLRDASMEPVPGHKSGNTNYQAALIDALSISLREPLDTFLPKVNAGRQRRKVSTFTKREISADVEMLEEREADNVAASPLQR